MIFLDIATLKIYVAAKDRLSRNDYAYWLQSQIFVSPQWIIQESGTWRYARTHLDN